MDLETALDRLPQLYAKALRMKRQGRSGTHIADELGVDPASVAPLLAIAEAKLRRALDEGPPECTVSDTR